MKLALTIQTPEIIPTVPVALLSGSLQEKAAKAAEWGADGLEIMTLEPRSLDWNAVRDSLYATGMQASAVASGAMAFAGGITLLHADIKVMNLARSRLHDLIDFAEAVGAPTVTVGSFRGRLAALGTSTAEARLRLADILLEGADYAATHSVRLAIEAINRYETDFIQTAAQGLDFVSSLDRAALGILLDTFHMNIEESSWDEPLRMVFKAGKLFHVHLGDNNRLPPGRGMIDFGQIVAILTELGYGGWLSAELFGRPDPDTAGRQTIDRMRLLIPKDSSASNPSKESKG